MKTSVAQKRYPLNDWMSDIDALFSSEAMAGNLRQLATDRFEKRYQAGPNPNENCLRLIHCLAWVRDNFQAMAAVGAVNTEHYTITNAAKVGLYLMFMDIEVARVGTPIDDGMPFLLESMKSLNDFRQSGSKSG